jgi:hypothetical protein
VLAEKMGPMVLTCRFLQSSNDINDFVSVYEGSDVIVTCVDGTYASDGT